MKASTKAAIGTFVKMADKQLNGIRFISWRTPDAKRFFLAPASINLNIPRFSVNPEHYEIDYILLGQLDMVH